MEKKLPYTQRKAKAKELLDEFRIDITTEVDPPKEFEDKANKVFKIPINVDESPEYLAFRKEFKEKNKGKDQYSDKYEYNLMKEFKQKYPKLQALREEQLDNYQSSLRSLKNDYKKKLKRMPMKQRKAILDKHEIHVQNDISSWGGEQGNFGLTVDSTYYEIMNEESQIPESWIGRVNKLQNQLNEKGCFIHMLGHPSAHEVVCLTDKELAIQKQNNQRLKELRKLSNKNAKEYEQAEKTNNSVKLAEKQKELNKISEEMLKIMNQDPADKYMKKRYQPFGKYTSHEMD